MLTLSPRRSDGTRFSKKARSSFKRLFSSSKVFTCAASWICAVCSIFSRDSLALAIARNLAASLSSLDIDSRRRVNSFCSSLRSKPANLRPASYIQAASASESERKTSMPSQRQYHAMWVCTVIFGAEIPNRWRNCFRSFGIRFLRCSGHHCYMRETCGLSQTEHDIHVLHRLPRCALYQIVDHRNHDQSVSIVWTMDRDATRIRGTHRARVGLTPARKHVHEGLVSIAVFVEFLEVRSLGDSGIEWGVHAANHRHQVRDKRQANVPACRLSQPLQDLRPMPMA